MADLTEGEGEYGEEEEQFEFPEIHEPELETQEEREKFYQEVRSYTILSDFFNAENIISSSKRAK